MALRPQTKALLRRKTSPTLAIFLDGWLASIRPSIRETTADSYARLIRQHLVPGLGQVPIHEITPGVLTAFYADLLAGGRHDGRGGLSPRTVAYAHTIVSMALADAVEQGQLKTNPAARVKPPKLRPPEIRVWSAEQVGAFLASVAEDRLQALWVLLCSTGLRRGEALGLCWRDFDPASGTLTIRRTLVEVGGRVMLGEPKTRRGFRTVDLDATTIVALEHHRAAEARAGVSAGSGSDGDAAIFHAPRGGRIWPSLLSRRFKTLVEQSGLPPIRLHDLRHTWATLALGAGVSPRVVSERLGHSSVGFTLEVYVHALPQQHREAAERVAALFRNPSEASV